MSSFLHFFFFPALPLLFRILFPLLHPALSRENVSGPDPKIPGTTSQNRNKFYRIIRRRVYNHDVPPHSETLRHPRNSHGN